MGAALGRSTPRAAADALNELAREALSVEDADAALTSGTGGVHHMTTPIRRG